jgi:hypothetical protein
MRFENIAYPVEIFLDRRLSFHILDRNILKGGFLGDCQHKEEIFLLIGLGCFFVVFILEITLGVVGSFVQFRKFVPYKLPELLQELFTVRGNLLVKKSSKKSLSLHASREYPTA